MVKRSLIVLLVVVILSGIIIALWLGPLSTDDDAPYSPSDDGVVGTWGEDEEGEAFLRVKDDGSLSGNDGCNGFSGSYSLSDDGSTLTFEDVAGTLRGCPDVDTWLSDTKTADLDDDTLTFFDEDDEEIGSLPRT